MITRPGRCGVSGSGKDTDDDSGEIGARAAGCNERATDGADMGIAAAAVAAAAAAAAVGPRLGAAGRMSEGRVAFDDELDTSGTGRSRSRMLRQAREAGERKWETARK